MDTVLWWTTDKVSFSSDIRVMMTKKGTDFAKPRQIKSKLSSWSNTPQGKWWNMFSLFLWFVWNDPLKSLFMYTTASPFIYYLASPHQHPSEVYPERRVNWVPLRGFLSANRAFSVSETREVSIPLPRPQTRTQILAEIIQIPTGSANLSAVPRLLPPSRWTISVFVKPSDANRQSPEKVYPAAPQSCCLSCADGLPRRGNSGLFRTNHHHQYWIIETKYGSSWWIMDVQNLHFQTGFNGPDRTSPALWDCLTTTRSLPPTER